MVRSYEIITGVDVLGRGRQRILDVAQRQALDGAHYLWGANGDMPSVGGPIGYAAWVMSKDSTTPEHTIADTTFCAAINYVPVDERGVGPPAPFVCAGRCFAVGNRWAAIIPKASASTNKNLVGFIDRWQSTPDAQYHWGVDLTPRKIRGQGPGEPMAYGSANPHLDGVLVWGEGCNETRHFDCWGFVNWVIKQATGVTITRGTSIQLQKGPDGNPAAQVLANDDQVLPADILVYPGHIAFATDGAPTMKTTSQGVQYQSFHVAQAESAVTGVNYNTPHDSPTTSRVRLSEAILRLAATRP